MTGEASTRASGTFSYGYDGGTSTGPGNPTSFKGTTSTFNADNQVTGTGYGYDGNGSPTAYKSSTLTFDPEQRMTGYNGTTQTDGYDGDGLRAWKQTDSDGDGSLRTYFLYDDETPVVEETSAGAVAASNSFGADGLISRHTSSGSVFYTFDERGNVSQRTSSTGAVISSDVYDAFGTRSSTGGADVFGYGAQAGYYTDAETGLVLCTHRYYDSSTGRWLTRDPIGYRGGINLYGYVGNDPVNKIDPSGEMINLPPIIIKIIIAIDIAVGSISRGHGGGIGGPRQPPIRYQPPPPQSTSGSGPNPPPDPEPPVVDPPVVEPPPVVDIPVIVCIPCIEKVLFPGPSC